MNTAQLSARRLRRLGNTYSDISRALGGVSKSTPSVWFRDLRLSGAARRRLMSKAQQRWAENIIRYNKWRAQEARRRAEEAIARAASEIGELSRRELQLIGTALYWAEGSKGSRWRLRFTNTDACMVRLMMQFFRDICQVPTERFSAQIHLHPHVSERRALGFWSNLTGLSPRHFIRPQRVVSRRSRGKRPIRRLPFGTLHITIDNGDIRNRVMGWVQSLQAHARNHW